MQTFHRSPFLTIHTEGALLPVDLLQRILAGDKGLAGLTPEDYHLSGEKVNEAINRAWNHLQGAWAAFQTSRGRLKEGDPGTTLTRERWLLPLFQELGYGRLQTAKAIEIEGKSYAISHTWGTAELPTPIHLVGCGVDIEKRHAGVSGASKSSPHSLMQELLNRDETRHWGLISNGLRLRVLRDNASLTRQAFLEFDLEAMFSGEIYADFAVLWLVCHQSRLEDVKPEGQWLERWSQVAQEQGTRALEGLRSGVEEAIVALGQGFLSHPANQTLRQQLKSGKLDRQQYFRQLLRLVYRLIFLFVAEDRDLLLLPEATPQERERYLKFYSTARLRRLAERQRGGRHPDLWQGLKLLTDLLAGNISGSREIGLPVLGGFLFSHKALPDLEAAQVDNQALLNAVRSLAFTQEKNSRRAVDYKNLGSEELGSVYESLLELQPILNVEAGTFRLTTAAGNERKTSGSYYTNTGLIKITLDSALDPVIAQAVLHAGNDIEKQIAALLALKVCDPASGSGHFLIAAARRISRRLAQLRSGDEEPSPSTIRHALREVIAHCIYGVDVNPMAVELCKVNLWLESIEPGKPLSFLDAHIQCGDSLVGVSPGLDIREIPDEAFNPAFGDDKAAASVLRKRNKRERSGQLGFRWKVTELTSAEDLRSWRAERIGQVDAMPEDDPAQVQAKAQAYAEFQGTQEYIQNRLEYDLWTAAFFWHLPKDNAEHMLAPTQQELIILRSGGSPDAALVEQVRQLAERLTFFHWELAFPQVYSGTHPGFDCVLGNPPWEMLQLEEQEFFAIRDPEIAALPGDARKKAIAELVKTNPLLATVFEEAKHLADAKNKYLRSSGRFQLTATGKMNTYALFAEHFRNQLSPIGYTGIILPTGIATDDTTKFFFGDLVAKRSLAKIVGFENEAFIFPAVHHAFKFCAFIMVGSKILIKEPEFVFFCRYFEHIRQPERQFKLMSHEIALINPNTLTMPVFRTKTDADLTRRIYKLSPVLINEQTNQNPWNVHFMQGLFNMTSDSNLFIESPRSGDLPLYEAKMFYHFDHRYSTYEGATQANLNAGILPQPTDEQKSHPEFRVLPRYWISKVNVENQIRDWKYGWFLCFRDITSNVVERTAIFSLVPRFGLGNNAPILFSFVDDIRLIACLVANLNSLIFDYITRQKIAGTHMNFFFVKQLPVLLPSTYTPTDIAFISSHVLELVYTAYDLKPFADDMGYTGEPFRWDEERRALLRAELDAYYAKLYGLTRDELRYILDPHDVYGPDFPGETFRVLKEKEIKVYGEYRTRRLVLEAWDRLEGIEPAKIEKPAVTEQPAQVKEDYAPPVKEKSLGTTPPRAVKERPVDGPLQEPLGSDFGLYKCEACGKMVMGFDREGHVKQKHAGRKVEWKKVR